MAAQHNPLASHLPDPAARDHLLALVAESFQQQARAVQIEVEHSIVREGEAEHCLASLASICRQLPAASWPAAVQSWLADNKAAALAGELQHWLARPITELLPRFQLQLMPTDFLGKNLRREILHRQDLAGLDTVLMLDLPPLRCAVPQALLPAWQTSATALFRHAAQALPQLAVERSSRPPLPAADCLLAAGLHLVGGPSTSALALLPEQLPQPAENGLLLLLHPPNELLCWPVRQASSAGALAVALESASRPGAPAYGYWLTAAGRCEWLPAPQPQ